MAIIVLYRSHCTSLHIHCTRWDGAGASFKRSGRAGGRSGVPGQNRLGPRSGTPRSGASWRLGSAERGRWPEGLGSEEREFSGTPWSGAPGPARLWLSQARVRTGTRGARGARERASGPGGQLAGGGGGQSPSAWAQGGLLGHAGPGDAGVRGRAGGWAGWLAGGRRRVARAAAWALARAGGPGMRAGVGVRARRRGPAGARLPAGRAA